MNKTTLLTAGLIAGVVAVFGYGYLGDETDPVKDQSLVESTVLKESEALASSDNIVKPVTVTGEDSTEKNTALVDENSYARTAPPPPPIRSNKAKDGNYTTPKAHGHEQVPDNKNRNAPPPPAGAN